MIRILTEEKELKRFRDKYGDELTDRFLARRKTLKTPYNDVNFWLKDNPLKAEDSYFEDDVEALTMFLDDIKSKSRTYQRKRAKEGAKTIYKDNNWQVISIDAYEAAVYYGKNTRWCISGNYEGDNILAGEGYWQNYENILMYVDRKTNKKYCFANEWVGNNELTLWDEEDNILYCNDKKHSGWFTFGTSELNPMPRIEYNGIVYPYIYIDENTGEKVYVKENDEEQFRLEHRRGTWW